MATIKDEAAAQRLATTPAGSGTAPAASHSRGADDDTFNTGSPVPTNTPTPATTTVTTTPTTGTTPTTTTPGTVAPTTAGTVATGATGSPSTLQGMWDTRKADSEGKINSLYDLQIENQKRALQSAYEQNLSDQEAARANIGRNYQSSANDLAVQYERNRRNLNEQAMAQGLNTGAGSQQQLALNQAYMTNYGKLRGNEAAAMTEADRQITNLKNQYQNSIAQAIANNDYQRAAALLDDYNSQNNWYEQQAQILASYGDFSAYASLYGQEQADAMARTWAMQNPDMAWAQGKITKEDYKKLTGRNPRGTGGGGYGGGGYGWSGGYWHNGVWHSNGSSGSGGGGTGGGGSGDTYQSVGIAKPDTSAHYMPASRHAGA